MPQAPEPVIERLTRNQNVYFTVHWSPFQEADKYRINSSVPAMSGVYELYYRDPYGKLILHEVDYVWYGGLAFEAAEDHRPRTGRGPCKAQVYRIQEVRISLQPHGELQGYGGCGFLSLIQRESAPRTRERPIQDGSETSTCAKVLPTSSPASEITETLSQRTLDQLPAHLGIDRVVQILLQYPLDGNGKFAPVRPPASHLFP